MSENKDSNQKIQIEIDEKVADGLYSNLAVIAHSNQEFVVDFIRIMPNVPKSKVKARIILTPQHAKRFMRALEDNIRKFEELHGSISAQEEQVFSNIQFNPSNAEA